MPYLDRLLADPTFVIVLIAVSAGCSVALLAWLLSRTLAEVPDEDREFKDPLPPLFRAFKWPVQWIAHYVDPRLSEKTRRQLTISLRQAGLEFSIGPAQYLAMRLLAACLLAGVAWWLVGSFDRGAAAGHGFALKAYLQAAACAAAGGWIYPAVWLRDRIGQRKRELLKTLPFYLDVITLCVEAGLNFQGAMSQAVAKGPKGVLRSEFLRVLRDIRAGKQRAQALRSMADRLKEPNITSFSGAVIQAEAMGMSLGPVLRAQADQRRSERFLQAEKLAMEAPVKMLFPLIAFIFPCTFVVLFFPIVIKFMNSGF